VFTRHPLFLLLLCRCAVHLQGGFNDFKAAPGGAATWLYLLSGRQVVVLLPPTAANRCASCHCSA
jgi:hypothetical protein